jgi:hypothetical protein
MALEAYESRDANVFGATLLTIVAPLGAMVIGLAVLVLGRAESEVDPLVFDLPIPALRLVLITPSADWVLFFALAFGLGFGARVAEI